MNESTDDGAPVSGYRWPLGEPCPGCGEVETVELRHATARVMGWRCAGCDMSWAISVVGPQLHLDRLVRTVAELSAARAILTQIMVLAEDAPTITDLELRNRLLALAEGAH